MKMVKHYDTIVAPVVTEKSTRLGELSQVVFKVRKDATKPQIKSAVEALFDVKVTAVNTLNVKGKVKRNRYGIARRSDWKKAYVRLAQGHQIDFTTAAE